MIMAPGGQSEALLADTPTPATSHTNRLHLHWNQSNNSLTRARHKERVAADPIDALRDASNLLEELKTVIRRKVSQQSSSVSSSRLVVSGSNATMMTPRTAAQMAPAGTSLGALSAIVGDVALWGEVQTEFAQLNDVLDRVADCYRLLEGDEAGKSIEFRLAAVELSREYYGPLDYDNHVRRAIAASVALFVNDPVSARRVLRTSASLDILSREGSPLQVPDAREKIATSSRRHEYGLEFLIHRGYDLAVLFGKDQSLPPFSTSLPPVAAMPTAGSGFPRLASIAGLPASWAECGTDSAPRSNVAFVLNRLLCLCHGRVEAYHYPRDVDDYVSLLLAAAAVASLFAHLGAADGKPRMGERECLKITTVYLLAPRRTTEVLNTTSADHREAQVPASFAEGTGSASQPPRLWTVTSRSSRRPHVEGAAPISIGDDDTDEGIVADDFVDAEGETDASAPAAAAADDMASLTVVSSTGVPLLEWVRVDEHPTTKQEAADRTRFIDERTSARRNTETALEYLRIAQKAMEAAGRPRQDWQHAASVRWQGTELRRLGEYEAAVQQCGMALSIVRAAYGDRHEALIHAHDLLEITLTAEYSSKFVAFERACQNCDGNDTGGIVAQARELDRLLRRRMAALQRANTVASNLGLKSLRVDDRRFARCRDDAATLKRMTATATTQQRHETSSVVATVDERTSRHAPVPVAPTVIDARPLPLVASDSASATRIYNSPNLSLFVDAHYDEVEQEGDVTLAALRLRVLLDALDSSYKDGLTVDGENGAMTISCIEEIVFVPKWLRSVDACLIEIRDRQRQHPNDAAAPLSNRTCDMVARAAWTVAYLAKSITKDFTPSLELAAEYGSEPATLSGNVATAYLKLACNDILYPELLRRLDLWSAPRTVAPPFLSADQSERLVNVYHHFALERIRRERRAGDGGISPPSPNPFLRTSNSSDERIWPPPSAPPAWHATLVALAPSDRSAANLGSTTTSIDWARLERYYRGFLDLERFEVWLRWESSRCRFAHSTRMFGGGNGFSSLSSPHREEAETLTKRRHVGARGTTTSVAEVNLFPCSVLTTCFDVQLAAITRREFVCAPPSGDSASSGENNNSSSAGPLGWSKARQPNNHVATPEASSNKEVGFDESQPDVPPSPGVIIVDPSEQILRPVDIFQLTESTVSMNTKTARRATHGREVMTAAGTGRVVAATGATSTGVVLAAAIAATEPRTRSSSADSREADDASSWAMVIASRRLPSVSLQVPELTQVSLDGLVREGAECPDEGERSLHERYRGTLRLGERRIRLRLPSPTL